MGSIWNHSIKSRDEVIEDIKVINGITLQKIFIEKTSLSILFSLDDKGIFNTKNIIKGIVKSFKSNKEKTIKLDLNEFYLFFNCLLDSKNIFYDDKLKLCIKNGTLKDETESGFCPICAENTVDTMFS